MPDEVALAWLAGLLEGEGYFGLNGHCPMIRLVMTDEDIVRRAADITGMGLFRGPVKHPTRGKDLWMWNVTTSSEAATIMRAVLPFMGVRRSARISEIITDWHPRRRGRLPDADVAEVRRLRDSDPQLWTYQRLAEKFNSSASVIGRVIRGEEH